MPAHRVNFDALNTPELVAWRLQMADEVTNAIARKIQSGIYGGQPSDVIAVLIAASADAMATVCVTEPCGYEQAAKLFSDGMFLRIMASREKAEAGVKASYTLIPVKTEH